jgi:hypothetical protein
MLPQGAPLHLTVSDFFITVTVLFFGIFTCAVIDATALLYWFFA